MKLIRYEYPNLSRWGDFDRFFDWGVSDFFRRPNLFNYFEPTGPLTEPAVDIYDNADNYTFVFELPGVAKKDINVDLENAVLTVSGERREKGKEGEESFSFSRSVSIPDGIDPNKVTAKLKDGLLTVTLPKAEERKPKTVAIS